MSVKNCMSIQCCKILFKFLLFMIIIISSVFIDVRAKRENEGWEWGLGPLIKRAERKTVISTENGEVSSVTVADGTTYHLQFITLEPNSLFLPVVLHTDMVFYVHTGSGKLTWMNENEEKSVDLRIGDVFRLPFGSIFFLESDLDPIRHKLRLYSIFPNSGRESLNEPYSSIRKMVLGFDKKVLQAAFHVPEDVIEEVLAGTEVPAIVHGVPKSTKKKKNLWEMEAQFMKTVLGRGSYSFFDNQRNKKKSSQLFNVFQEKPDFENCNGWSTVINRKKLPALKGSQIGIYVVNLTKGSMMGPHWNPMATEIGIAIQGEGMVRVVCSKSGTGVVGCKNMRFKVEEGDVFVVPRFDPMAQMAFNNDSFVFVGFSTTTKKHHPQYLTGKASVLRTLDRQILEASFNVGNTTMHQILEAQGDSVILECISCAEEEKRLMEEERRKEEEEAKKKEEEERRKEEEEEARKAEEERREKEAEEERKRQEEEAREREEEEIRRRQEEEEARRRQEEEEEERERQEARKKQEEEEAAQREAEQARREEEEAEKRRQEEEESRREEEARRRQQEEEAEEARRKEEEAAAKRQHEEEAEREAEEARKREEEEAAKRQQEEEAEREAEEARRIEEEEAQREAEEARRIQQEEEAERARRREEEAETRRKEEEEEESRRQEEESRRSEEEAAREAERERQEEAERQEEEARRQEEETGERHQQQETEEEEPGQHEMNGYSSN